MLRVGIAGPVSLDLLSFPLGRPANLPESYEAPVVSHFVNALLRRGHKVVVYTSSRSVSTPILIDQGQLAVWIVRRHRPRSSLLFYAAERRDLVSVMKHAPAVDLIHAMWSYEFALAALQTALPTIVHCHDHAWTILRHNREPYRLLRWLMSEYVLRIATWKAANSQYLKAAFGPRGRDMRVIPNFLPDAAESARRRPRQDHGYLVTVSNGFAGHKNVKVGLRAFASLRQRGVASEYRLIGDGLGSGGEAHAYAHAHELANGVRFLGTLPYRRTLEEIAGATLLLHCALEESFGMTVLEAMASGVPVIGGSSSGNVPELLDFGRCGFLCDVRDYMALARTTEEVLTNRERMREIAIKARARYMVEYSEEVAMTALERLYAEVRHGAQ